LIEKKIRDYNHHAPKAKLDCTTFFSSHSSNESLLSVVQTNLKAIQMNWAFSKNCYTGQMLGILQKIAIYSAAVAAAPHPPHQNIPFELNSMTVQYYTFKSV